MEFYNPSRSSFFLTGISEWWWLPDESGGRTLVASVTAAHAERWVLGYTFLVTLIFMAACDLATAVVLTTFRLGTSGTRHAILVTYYNGGSQARTLKVMFGYLRNALLRCRKGGVWSVDRDAFWGSFGLALLAVTLISGDVSTRYFLGGRGLVVRRVAQVNPDVVFYPSFQSTSVDGG